MTQMARMSPSTPLKLGWIPYWNLLPLRAELERVLGHEIEFHRGHPSHVNKLLGEGKVAVAPSSSVCLVKNSQMEIALPLGIACFGSVLSVYIGLGHEDLHLMDVIKQRQLLLRDAFRSALSRYDGDARKVAASIFQAADQLPPLNAENLPHLSVTPASAASTQLARILYRLWFGAQAYEHLAADHSRMNAAITGRRSIELLIGDEALVKRPLFRAVIDLGEIWRELTDLPFVFAVWQSSDKQISSYWGEKILEAAELAQARMRVEPTHYYPDPMVTDTNGRTIDLATYWRGIHYRLGPTHFRGLALYLALTRCLNPGLIDDQAVINIMRWEAFGQERAASN